MTTTDQIPPLPAAPSSVTRGPLIGIHLSLTDPQALTGVIREHVLLAHIITSALRRQRLLREQDACGSDKAHFLNGRIFLVAYEREICGFAPVTDIGLAVPVIITELTAVELLPFAHLAWLDLPNGVWATLYPIPEPMPFDSRVADLQAWLAESPESKRERLIKMGQKAAQICEDLGNEERPVGP